jgi:hypothetical protein
MRTREFEVPYEVMPDFARTVEEWGFSCDILGATDDDEIIVEVSYEKDEKEGIHQLTDIIDEYYEDEE